MKISSKLQKLLAYVHPLAIAFFLLYTIVYGFTVYNSMLKIKTFSNFEDIQNELSADDELTFTLPTENKKLKKIHILYSTTNTANSELQSDSAVNISLDDNTPLSFKFFTTDKYKIFEINIAGSYKARKEAVLKIQGKDISIFIDSNNLIVHKQHGVKSKFIVFAILTYFIIIFFILGILYLTRNLSKENKFLVYSLIFCFLYLFIRPPCSQNDDLIHYDSAYNMSNMYLGLGNARDMGYLPKRECDVNLLPDYYPDKYFYYYHAFNASWSLYFPHLIKNFTMHPDTEITQTLSNKVLQPQRSYFFSSLVITLCRLLNLNQFITYYAGASINIILCILILFVALKRNKSDNNIFFICIASLPALLMSISTYSYDGILASLAISIIIYVLNFENIKLKLFDYIFLSVLCLFLFPIKIVYFPIALLPVFVLFINSTNKHKKLIISVLCICIVAVALIYAIFYSSNANTSRYSIAYFMHHPLSLFNLIFDYFNKGFDFTNISQIVLYRYGHNLALSEICAILILILLFISTPVANQKTRNLFLGTALFITGALIIVSCTWTNLSDTHIYGLCPRYFVPILPLLYIGLKRKPYIDLTKNINPTYQLLTVLNIFYIIELPFSVLF